LEEPTRPQPDPRLRYRELIAAKSRVNISERTERLNKLKVRHQDLSRVVRDLESVQRAVFKAAMLEQQKATPEAANALTHSAENVLAPISSCQAYPMHSSAPPRPRFAMAYIFVVVLSVLLGAAVGPNDAAAQSCELHYPPRGLIDAEYTRLDRMLGPLKCPLALEEPVLDREGAFQDFERGQIVWSPQSGNRDAILAAYYKPECGVDRPPCVVFRWKNMPASDVFIVRLADQEHAGIVPEEAEMGQLDVLVDDKEIEYEEAEDNEFNVDGRVFLSRDETLSQTSGALHIRADRFRAGRYKFVIKGCTRDSSGIGTSTDCPHDWSNPVYVDYEFLDLKSALNSVANPGLKEFYVTRRRNNALAYACRRASNIDSEEASGAFGATAMALLGSETPPISLSPGVPEYFTCPRQADNLTKHDTKAALDGLQAGDEVLALVGNDCNSGLIFSDPSIVALKNECLMALALRGLRKTKVVGTDTYFEDDGWLSILGGVGLGLGPIGAAAGAAIADECSNVHGDYDFDLQWILRIMLVHGPTGTNRIDDRTWKHLLTLLTERGKGSFDKGVLVCGIEIPSIETENHIWMIESARYLTNALLTADALRRGAIADPAYDNVKNGQRDLILEQLRAILINDFYEFNSRPYQRLAIYAIRNLYELVGNDRPNDPVAKAAEVVLDYLAGKYALSTNGLRRVAGFRRQPHRARYGTMFQALGDGELGRMTLLSGLSRPLLEQRFGRVHPYEAEPMVFHGTGRAYRVPDIIRDYMARGIEHVKPQDVLQRFSTRGRSDERGLEIHFSTPRFLLSAGGVSFTRTFGSEESSVLPTTLLLTPAGRGWQEMIRFSGTPEEGDRFNTCVGPNFACGIDPVIPSTIPPACVSTHGQWSFINFNSSSKECNRPYGVHVALYTGQCTEQSCAYGGSSWGLLEAQEVPIPALPPGPNRLAMEIVAFLRFQADVLSNNSTYQPFWDQANYGNTYRTTKGRLIQFNAGPLGPEEWSINHINMVKTPEPKDWPVAQGDVMNGLPNEPCIQFDNAARNTRLILDLRDLRKDPNRWKCEVPLQRLSVSGSSPSCRMTDPCP
jgi:hypothetical protein